MGEVSEAVPLCAALGVHGVEIIIGVAFGKGFDFMLEDFTSECWLVGYVEGEAVADLAPSPACGTSPTYFTGTISPLLISLAAAATRVGVRRLRRPICKKLSSVCLDPAT